MKVASIIAEFNPFHNGHMYLVNEIREKCNADYVVAVMSGDFVQRGAPAVCDKFLRAEIAVKCGVDAVFELPCVYSTSAAPDFAFGGVTAVNALGCTDILAFGSECGDLELLRKATDLLSDETPEFKAELNAALRSGLSYPAAVSKAASAVAPEISDILADPNNTLGIEYLKALKKTASSVLPFTVKRHISSHSEAVLLKDGTTGLSYTGASYIRKHMLKEGKTEELFECVPKAAFKVLSDEHLKQLPISENDFTLPLSLLLSSMTEEEIDDLSGNNDAKAKLKKTMREYLTFEELRNRIKDRSLTETAAGRLLVHALLGIKDSDTDRVAGVSYLRLLAMNRSASPLLKKIKETAKVPLITKMADFDLGSCPMLAKDVYASDLYCKILSEKYGCAFKNDIIRSPYIY